MESKRGTLDKAGYTQVSEEHPFAPGGDADGRSYGMPGSQPRESITVASESREQATDENSFREPSRRTSADGNQLPQRREPGDHTTAECSGDKDRLPSVTGGSLVGLEAPVHASNEVDAEAFLYSGAHQLSSWNDSIEVAEPREQTEPVSSGRRQGSVAEATAYTNEGAVRDENITSRFGSTDEALDLLGSGDPVAGSRRKQSSRTESVLEAYLPDHVGHKRQTEEPKLEQHSPPLQTRKSHGQKHSEHRVTIVDPVCGDAGNDNLGSAHWASPGVFEDELAGALSPQEDYSEDQENAIPGQIPDGGSENPTPSPKLVNGVRPVEHFGGDDGTRGSSAKASANVAGGGRQQSPSILSAAAQLQPPRPTVKVVVTSDLAEIEGRANAKRPTFFESLLKDDGIDYGIDLSRLDKLRVVTFSGGRVFDAVELEENGIVVKEQKRFVPFDRLKEFIQVIVDDMEKMKRQSIDAITEMEWNFRILDQKLKKRCEFQVNEVKKRALNKLTVLRTTVLEYKTQMEYFEAQYKDLKDSFDTKLQAFKEQMPRDLQELDAQWASKMAELQKVLDATQEELDAGRRCQKEVGEKIKRLMEEITRAESGPFDASVNDALVEKMGDLLIMVRLVLRDNTREQVALFLQQLSARVVSDYHEKRAGSLEHENQVLKDACGPETQARIEKYEKEIADLQAAREAAQSPSAAGSSSSGEEVQKLQNELTVLRAENMILRRKAGREDAAGDFDRLQEDAPRDGAGVDPLLIQDISRTVEELERQVESLKNENEQLQMQLVVCVEETAKGGGAAAVAAIGSAKASDGTAAKMVQQLQQKNKALESQVEPMKKRIRELETAQKRGGGDEQRVKELEMKLKDAEAENRKQQKQFELELSKSSKGSGMELKKLENQVQKLTERAVNAETALDATDKQLKEASKERDGLKKETEDMKKQMGVAQLIAAEVETLRVETKDQKAKLVELEESYKQEKFLRKKYYNEIEDMKGKIRVYCRVRPMAKYEIEKQCKQSVFPVDEYSVKVLTSKGDKEFMYDRTFPPECTQEEVYEDTKRLIQSVIDGFNVCIFAYGQTGSGKTFTIQGGAGNPGIAPRAINDLFDTLNSFEKGKFKYEAEVYMCELYNNQLIDLLLPEEKKKTPPALEIKKDATGMVMIPGITLKKVADKESLAKTFAWGLDARHVSGTAMNAESSRSHLIFSVIVRVEDLVAGKRASGKLSLIDLAGSERVSKSGVTKERLVEAKEINKSLSALGDVISALSSGESFIPYRNHKLTQVMSDSLGGTAKTLMFVNISPADYNTDETVTSLMYASRVKLITNDASKQVESKQLATLKDKVKLLTKAVEKLKKGEDISDLEKKFQEEEPAAPPEPEGCPPTENDEDFEEPPDLPAD
ncbi:hypothetical protein NCLIV_014870 [Neospora caninum Liverpool]|nr:hypothetical protein NCLIV_014870 [Neospora caninum Liverpool]CBZ51692.1 hypothetical protein NCLIV_014870 [Neospora caninum Liverpool]|eukprot:XP_003881725.1 hypothetical protein NCLIV_014870 [Neospora caninum Liverpool]